MKNVIKKLVATAMAFTLLGTGTAVTKTIAPQFDNSITASAACNHVVGSTSWSSWETVDTRYGWIPIFTITMTDYQERTCKCIKCGRTLYKQKRHRTTYFSEERTTLKMIGST